MPNKKINQLDAKTAVGTDLMLVGDPTNGTAYKSTLANLPLVPTSRTLTINGVAFDLSANRAWTIDALPSQTGNAGKYLTTNGSVASWGTIDLSGFVLTSRTLTINGTTYDLSANRSWTIAAGITGSGIANQLTYWNGTDSVTGSAGLVYNDSTGAFSLSKSQNNPTAINITNATSGTNGRAGISLISNTASGQFTLQKYSTIHTAYKINLATDAILYNDTSGDISILNDFSTGKIKFASGGSSTAQMTLTSAGRLLLGITSESTYLLDVNGTARVNNRLTITGQTGNIYLSIGTGTGNAQFYWSSYVLSIFGVKTCVENLIADPSGTSGGANRANSSVDSRGYLVTDSIGIGTTTSAINASAIAQINSTTQGFLPPRMTTTQRDAIASPATGLIVYVTDSTEGLYERTSTAWRLINASGGGGSVDELQVALISQVYG